MSIVLTIFLLLVLFQVKHFVADYPLQGKYMLGKFKQDGWVLPLAAHCSVHMVMTFVIVFPFVGLWALPLAVMDFVLHFGMDRVKASPDLLGKFKPTEPKFWWSLGFDQMFHHLTHYLIIYFVLILMV